METSLEVVVANLTGKTRRESLNGREYIVAPLTLIVPGVLNGSRGPLFYPPEEVARDPGAWNGMPLVVYHPVRNGVHVSARDPEVLATQAVGHVYRTKIGDTLTAEGWFDVEHTRRVDSRVLSALERGEPIELSTGLFTDNQPAQNGASHNGRPYSFVARNYRPDHVAILPDQVGACSLRDGCGVLANADAGVVADEFEAALAYVTDNVGLTDNAHPSAGLDMTPEKACKILRDKMVNGHKLTKAQRGMFGAKCGERDEPKGATTNTEGNTVFETKAAAVQFLTANCDCWKGDAETLNKMDEGKVRRLAEDAATANAAREVLGGKLTVNAGGSMTEEMRKKCKEMYGTTTNLSAEQVEDLEFARAEKTRQKAVLANRLVANFKGDDAGKRARFDKLMAEPLAKLQELVEYLPPAPTGNNGNPRPSDTDLYRPGFFGAGGGYSDTPPTGNRATATDPNDVLEIPTDNLGDGDPIVKRLRTGAVA